MFGEEHLLEFDARAAAWRWDANRIRAKGFTDNVAELWVAGDGSPGIGRRDPADRRGGAEVAEKTSFPD